MLPDPSRFILREIRCPNCHKLLFKIYGYAEVEICCPRCNAKILLTHSDQIVLVPTP
jgi:phage FluMu protein Com